MIADRLLLLLQVIIEKAINYWPAPIHSCGGSIVCQAFFVGKDTRQEGSIKVRELKYHLSWPWLHWTVHIRPKWVLAQWTLKDITLCCKLMIELQIDHCSTLLCFKVWPETGSNGCRTTETQVVAHCYFDQILNSISKWKDVCMNWTCVQIGGSINTHLIFPIKPRISELIHVDTGRKRQLHMWRMSDIK